MTVVSITDIEAVEIDESEVSAAVADLLANGQISPIETRVRDGDILEVTSGAAYL